MNATLLFSRSFVLKLSACILFLSACGSAFSAESKKSGPVDYADPVYHINQYKENAKGTWETAKNWGKKHLPEPEETAIIQNNSCVSLSSKVSVAHCRVGGRGTSSLTIEEGAELNVQVAFNVTRNDGPSVGLVVFNGGTARAGLDDSGKGKLAIGVSATHSNQSYVKMIRGTYEGGIIIGSDFPNTATGTLSVIGTGGTIKARFKRDTLFVSPYGAIEFVLDAEGVSVLDYKANRAEFIKGAKLIVDGTRYAATENKSIPLIKAGRVVGAPAISLTGFDEKYAPKVVAEKDGFTLKVPLK